MTYREIEKALSSAGISEASLEACLLLEKFCDVKPSSIPFSKNIDFESEELANAVSKRKERFPLQYILEEWYFCGQKYKVNPNCLIPRPDTELLVELSAQRLPSNAYFADLCTGSGCVAISLLCQRSDCHAIAAELYPDTLSLATENALLNGVSKRFEPILCDVLSPAPLPKDRIWHFDAIISNPPYIPTGDLKNLSKEVLAEPRAALNGGEDGMLFYREIIKGFRRFLNPDGFFAFEMGFDLGDKMRQLAKESGLSCQIFCDLGGNERVAILK